MMLIFFLIILFLRVIIVEPYGVPTGSMAPTLLGNHLQIKCDRCGHRIDVGENRQETHTFCPNCGSAMQNAEKAESVVGDRLLVNKTVYFFRNPKRWEVAVFQCPSDYSKPYVKRVVGLPGESIQIRDGDIWIDGELARKTLKEALACAIPIWEYAWPPRPSGWSEHFVIEGDGQANLEAGRIQLTANNPEAQNTIAFRNWSFENLREEPFTDLMAYNNPSRSAGGELVHDFILEWSVKLSSVQGKLDCELTDGDASIRLEVLFESRSTVLRLWRKVRNKNVLLREAECPAFIPGKAHRFALALVDRRASVSFDGSEWFAAFDLWSVADYKPVAQPFRFQTQGINGELTELRLLRDIHYRASGDHAVHRPLKLGLREYFMLGDNSPNSDDSRSWPIPGVPEKNFLGKPFLIHQPSRTGHLSLGGSTYYFPTIDWSRVRWLH